jgi:hypothetical protein
MLPAWISANTLLVGTHPEEIQAIKDFIADKEPIDD